MHTGKVAIGFAGFLEHSQQPAGDAAGSDFFHPLDFAWHGDMDQAGYDTDGDEAGQHQVKLPGVGQNEERLDNKNIG